LKDEKWTKEKMGPYGWTLLHLIAAKLPSELTEEEVHKFKIFMHLLYLKFIKFLLKLKILSL
jgi:hypothetical protein